MSRKKKQKILPSLTAALPILLAGCNSTDTPANNDIAAVCAGPSVKSWVADSSPPPDVLHYLKLIGDQQEAIRGRPCNS